MKFISGKKTDSLWYEKYGFVNTKIDFDLHLDKNDLALATQLDENTHLLKVHNCEIEFGIEKTLDNVDLINLNFGFFKVKMKQSDFEKALTHFRKKEKDIYEGKEKT